MKKYMFLVFVGLFSILSPSGPALADRADDCVNLVNKCIDFFQKNGRDYTLKVLSCKGPFTDKELYVFALSMDNIMLAHPYKKKLIGQNMDEYKDVKGKKLFRRFRNIVEAKGEGWVDYWWAKPGEKGEFLKRSFVKRIPGENVYVGAGYYP